MYVLQQLRPKIGLEAYGKGREASKACILDPVGTTTAKAHFDAQYVKVLCKLRCHVPFRVRKTKFNIDSLFIPKPSCQTDKVMHDRIFKGMPLLDVEYLRNDTR